MNGTQADRTKTPKGKPFHYEELVARLRAVLRRHERDTERAMSQENVELVLDSFRLDPNDVEARAALMHPQITATAVPGWPEPGPFVGRDAVLAETKRLTEWGEIRFTDIEVVADEGDWVVVAYRWHVRGAGSGISTHFDVVTAIRVKTAASSSGTTDGAEMRPSRPPGCGSRRCRGRTLRGLRPGPKLRGDRLECGKHLRVIDSDSQFPRVIVEGEPEEGTAASLDFDYLFEGSPVKVLGKLNPNRIGTAFEAGHALGNPGVAGTLLVHARLVETAHRKACFCHHLINLRATTDTSP
jgi:SnoaL-like domain